MLLSKNFVVYGKMFEAHEWSGEPFIERKKSETLLDDGSEKRRKRSRILV